MILTRVFTHNRWLILTAIVVLCCHLAESRTGIKGLQRSFLVCRRECKKICNYLSYLEDNNQDHCHNCLMDCMKVFLTQASAVGVSFKDLKEGAEATQKRQRRHPAKMELKHAASSR